MTQTIMDWSVYSSLGRFRFLLLSRSFPARSFGTGSTFVPTTLFHIVYSFTPSPNVPVHILYLGNIVNRVFEDLQKTKAPNSGDFCAFAGSRGIAVVLEKTGCEHVEAAAQAKAIFSIGDTKEPSAEATLMGGKFYSDVWMKVDREIVDKAIKKSEKESHDAQVEAKEAEEAVERALIIGTPI
jgi:hypothetical protein